MFSWFKTKSSLSAQTKMLPGYGKALVAFKNSHQAKWTPRRYDQLADEGYQKNVLVYRCVHLIARNAASIPLLLYHKDKHGMHEVEHHPLLNLLKNPNDQQRYSSFVERVLSHLLLSGNSYIEGFFANNTLPEQLYSLRPDRVSIIPGNHLLPRAYEYKVDNSKRIIPVPESGSQHPLLHLKLFHPLNDWYGMSPLEAASRSVDEHNAIGNHNLSLLQNGGRPSGAIIFKGDENLNSQQRQELRESLSRIYQGEYNAGKIAVLEGDFTWKEMGLSPRDMDFIEGKCMSGREIAMAFGVPPMLVGIPGDSTFSNYKEARLHLWEDTILPLLNMLVSELNGWLCQGPYTDYSLAYNSDYISALAPKREALWQKINEADFLTLNEKREALGYSPLTENIEVGGKMK